jgi:hypothetical protein
MPPRPNIVSGHSSISSDPTAKEPQITSAAYHKELYAPWKCQTHGDWNRADMDIYRAKLEKLATRHGVSIGPPAKRVTPHC